MDALQAPEFPPFTLKSPPDATPPDAAETEPLPLAVPPEPPLAVTVVIPVPLKLLLPPKFPFIV